MLLLVLVCAACDTPSELDSPTSKADPSEQSIEVSDDLERVVRLSRPARRVIALSPHLTELMFEIGAGHLLVAVSSYSDYPSQAQQIERIGDAFRVDYERLVQLRPDLVLVWGSGNAARTLERLEQLGIAAFVSEPRRLDQVESSLLRLGVLVNQPQQAQIAARAFASQRQQLLEQRQPGSPVTVFVQLDDSPLYTVNGDHLISEVLSLCNARNIFAQLPVLAPTVGVEAILAADPQLIVASDAIPATLFPARWEAYPGMRATQSNGFLRINPDLMHRQSSRILEGARQVCQFISQRFNNQRGGQQLDSR